MTTEDEIKAEYTSSLADLTFNSKPLINVLTMLAEENLPNAKVIVEAIEEHLAKVSTDVKLPILYLIDCIVKNVGRTYTALFSQNIVTTFCSVFKLVDEKTRSEMFKLRQTWNDVFPQMKLYAIDVQISTIDPAWPVTAHPSNSIHLNPKFLKNSTPPSKANLPTVPTEAPIVKPVPTDIDKETLLMQEQLIQKQKELLELQRKTLELEVLQTQVKLQEQFKTGGPPPISTNILLKPEVAKQLLPEAMTKSRPTGITSSIMNHRLQNNVPNQPRINPVNPALAAARPIRDPRLLRQQQQKIAASQPVVSNPTTTTVPAQKTAVLENNKNVTNKLGVRDIPKDPRLSNKVDKKSKTFPKSREPSTTLESGQNSQQSVFPQKSDKSPRGSIKSNLEKSAESSPKLSSNSSNSSLASSGSSSLGSPTKGKNRSPNKHKKRDRPEGKRSQDVDVSSNKREKISPKSDNSSSGFSKNSSSEVSSTFKSVKNSTKNRNYMRRNARDSPMNLQDEDLRSLPLSEKSSRVLPVETTTLELPAPEMITPPSGKPMDIDLRQLPQITIPPAIVGKKRSSSDNPEQTSKKSRSFDVLFGSEDTDLRQLPVAEPERQTPVIPERPPTPPPPIISATEPVIEKPVIQTSPNKADLDAVRAKLANATNRDKIMSKSFHKNKLQQEAAADQDLRISLNKVPPSVGLKRKITISPEEEKVIKSGQLTKEQEKQILNKIFMQIEKDKLREAKIKDQEESLGDISLQPISDDEFGSDTEEKGDSPVRQPDLGSRIGPPPPPPPPPPQIPPPPMPFNDKDERLNLHQLPQIHPIPLSVESLPPMQPIPQNVDSLPPIQPIPQNVDSLPPIPNVHQNMDSLPPIQPPPFFPRGEPRRHPFRGGNQPWRGRGRMPGPLQSRPPIRPWLHQQHPPMRWRNPGPQGGPFIPPSDDESSRSPGQDHGPPEVPLLQDEIKTLNIDGVPRDIRVYDETAIIFLSWDEPREISFQSGARRIIFNNNESYLLTLGDEYKECLVNGFPFRVKLGVPSRELFINGIGFECFFGGAPIHITVNGISMAAALDGPPPQVKIGDVKRTDLVAGKIKLIINAKIIIPVFLDGKLQTFIIDGKPCTLKFVDALKRVLINDVPFNVEFGGLPKPFIVHGTKHYLRFSVLPKGMKPGFVRIKDMEGEAGASPIREDENSQDGFAGPLEAEEPLRPDLSRIRRPTGVESPDNRSSSPSIFNNILQPGLNNFDVISNNSQSIAPVPTTGGYQVELPGLTPSTEPSEGAPTQQVPPPTSSFNINELFQKLVESGFVKTKDNKNDEKEAAPSTSNIITTTASTIVTSSTTTPVISLDIPVTNGKGPQQPLKKPQDSIVTKPQKRTLSEILRPITFTRPETLKIRQAPLYTALYAGMQCSSCGMRFSPESSMLYSQHLDWHFRQNRKGKKNARVANSRKWYYSLGDWKNYEEIEDLEEREKNYFDQQLLEAEVAEEGGEEVEIPTVPADPGSTDERCHVCRDAFEQFFNEEKEEWHLRNAIKVNDNTYHPVCYDDYQQSILDITLDDSKIEDTPQPQNKLIPGLEIVLDDDDTDDDMAPSSPNDIVSLAESDDCKMPADSPEPEEDSPEEDGDDDDVILNEVAPIKIVVDDDDDDQPMNEVNAGGQPVKSVKKEKHVEDDGFVDLDDVGLVSLNNVGQIKIKTEPVDKDEKETSILDTSRISNVSESATDPKTLDDEIQLVTSQPESVTSHPQLITSIDGNVELVSDPPSVVPTTISGGAKIKINISKPLPVITPKENSEVSDSSDVNVKPSEVLMEEPEILRYKPSLQNVPLRKLSPVKKGTELTGLCSIM